MKRFTGLFYRTNARVCLVKKRLNSFKHFYLGGGGPINKIKYFLHKERKVRSSDTQGVYLYELLFYWKMNFIYTNLPFKSKSVI